MNAQTQLEAGPLKTQDAGAGTVKAIFRSIFSFPLLLGTTLVLGVVVVVSAGGAASLFIEGDTWWHVAIGNQILSTGHWPTSDAYSFTVRGNPWMAYEWLGEVIMALAWRMHALQGLHWLLVLLSAVFVLLTYVYAWVRTGNHLASAAVAALLMLVDAPGFTLRPQLLGYIFLMVTLISLDLFKQDRIKSLWFLPAVFLLWVNTHGSFVLGLFFLAVYWASGLVDFRWANVVAERWDDKKRFHLLLTSLLSGLALFVTPYGSRLAAYPMELKLLQPLNVQFAPEWLQPDFSATWGQAFLLFVFCWIALQLIAPITYRLEVIAPLLLFTYESFVHCRFLLVFVAVFGPVLASMLIRWFPPYDVRKERYWMNAVFVAVLILICFALLPSNPKLQQTLQRRYPVGAVQYLRSHPFASGMLNDDHWGGFLILSLWPEQKVFIDGRLDIYEYAGVLADYVAIRGATPEAPALLRRYGIRACLLYHDVPLAGMLKTSSEWQTVYQDENSIIFERKGP